MNDKEIIKALECCTDSRADCSKCPCLGTEIKDKITCGLKMTKNALDLINRQQAEIERLQNLTEKDFEHTAISTVERHQKWIKYRAIKEFAKKIRQKISAMVCSPDLLTLDDYDKCIDDVLKEMVGDNDV